MHEEGCDRCRSNESYGHSLTELAVPACKSGEYNPPPSVPHMDGKRAAPRKGRRVVFAGIRFLCRAGPMCPAEKCVPGGGAGALSARRGRRPAVERSGTNALGVRRPVSAAAPRWETDSHASDGGARGPRPTGCGGHTGRAESSAPTKQNKNRAKRDVEDGVSDGITRRPAGMRLRVAPIRLTTFRDAGMIAVVPSHS